LCCYVAAAVARQAKYLEEKLKIQQGEEDEGDDEGKKQQQEAPGSLWGASKKAYYDADVSE
jgi:hypothetical protein